MPQVCLHSVGSSHLETCATTQPHPHFWLSAAFSFASMTPLYHPSNNVCSSCCVKDDHWEDSKAIHVTSMLLVINTVMASISSSGRIGSGDTVQ